MLAAGEQVNGVDRVIRRLDADETRRDLDILGPTSRLISSIALSSISSVRSRRVPVGARSRS